MDDRSLRVLEFPKVLQRLQALTTYGPAGERVDGLRPVADRELVLRWQAETTEACRLLGSGVDVYLGHLEDIRPAVRRAAIGGVLEEPDLAAVAETLATAKRLRSAILQCEGEVSLLREAVRALPDLQGVERAISSRLNEEGQLRDDASPQLRSVRQRLQVARLRLRATLDEWVRRAAQQGALQEAGFTVRNGRYVLPVRQDRRDAVPGLVHDQSASGQTVFIEPAPLVEMGNRIRELEAEEREERQRILAYLSARVGERAPDIQLVVDTLAFLDFTAAKARLSRRYEAISPEVAENGEIVLRASRHPLLEEERLEGRLAKVEPLEVSCPPGLRVLLITGPNTGGKTVALKTVGLLASMHQAGLHVPAKPGTRLPIFSQIFADIGDEQSIEQSLSTFSSHMSHIVHILRRVDGRSLVLLDELGAGTDPQEGAALAMAILDELARVGATTFATSHYGQLKSFVHARRDMLNASMEFDAETLAPTYRLRMGLPGRSNALEIAERLGLPDPLVEAARNYLGVQAVQFEQMLADIERQQRESAEERARAESVRRQLEALQRELEEARRAVERERAERLREAAEEARDILRRARREAEEWIARFRRAGWEEKAAQAQEARRALEREMSRLEAAIEKDEGTKRPAAASPQDIPLQPGVRVHVASLGQEGEVVSVAGKEVTVQMGPMRTVVAREDVRVVGLLSGRGDSVRREDLPGAGRGRVPAEGGVGGHAPTAAEVASIPREIHLRGMTTEEALYELERFLDRARWAGIERVRIVHGKGTGALRRAVADYLSSQPGVRGFHLASPQEGGEGATIVELE